MTLDECLAGGGDKGQYMTLEAMTDQIIENGYMTLEAMREMLPISVRGGV